MCAIILKKLTLIVGGAAATILKGRGALQDIDQISLFKSICKTCSTVKSVREIAPTLRMAIHEAQSGTPGTEVAQNLF